MDRKELAAKSSVISLTSKIIAALMSFICRKVFIQYLGTDLLGINSTLVQVLETLSLTELGFQTTIVFQLYRPLVEQNYEEISKIMMLLKKIYFFIGIIIFLIGIGVSPFLHKIITNVKVGIDVVYPIYFIMLVGTASSYFLSYNRALIQADQKVYINSIIDSGIQILGTLLKIFSIIICNSIIIYTIIGTLCTILGNLVSFIYYKKHYSWINNSAKCEKRLFDDLITKTKDVFIGRIGCYIYSSTDNLVISAFVGTNWVGLVGNYSTITNMIKMVIFGLTMPIQPMLGNFAIDKSKEDTEKIMDKYGFIRFAMALFLLIPTMFLSDFFIGVFYGEKYILPPVIIILLVADLFIICMQGAIGELVDALGYFKQERNMYITYAVLNLTLSIVGAKIGGIVPVFAATVITQLVAWVWRSKIAYHYYFKSKSSLINYWVKQIKYVGFYFAFSFIIFGLMQIFELPKNLLSFVIYGIIVETALLAMFVLFFHKNEEYQYMKRLVFKLKLKR